LGRSPLRRLCSLEVGDDMGKKIALYLIANSLKPVR
jgi:hypothetical protein